MTLMMLAIDLQAFAPFPGSRAQGKLILQRKRLSTMLAAQRPKFGRFIPRTGRLQPAGVPVRCPASACRKTKVAVWMKL
jgi:hypothetical protein